MLLSIAGYTKDKIYELLAMEKGKNESYRLLDKKKEKSQGRLLMILLGFISQHTRVYPILFY